MLRKFRLPRRTLTDVVWGVIDKKSNHWVSPTALAPWPRSSTPFTMATRLALFPTNGGRLPEREFEVVEFDGGTETIELDASNAAAPEIRDMVQLDDQVRSDPPAGPG
jgi:hypothetical protein